MNGLVFNGHDLGEHCRCRTISVSPVVDVAEPCVIKVELALDAARKMSALEANRLRHKVAAMLAANEPATLRLPEDNELEYRDVSIKDVSRWDSLIEDGKCTVTFECADPIAYGHEVTTREEAFEIEGTHATYPVFELVASEGDSVMVLDIEYERFINVIHAFAGGETVRIDCANETVNIDGVDASAKVGMYSDFFSLDAGACQLAFAGCSEHKTTYFERLV